MNRESTNEEKVARISVNSSILSHYINRLK